MYKYIYHSIGIPSTPVLVDTRVTPGMIRFILSTKSSGDSTTFKFRVNVTNTNDNSLVSFESSQLNYISNSNVTIDIPLPDGGIYTFTIYTVNQYGQSERFITTQIIMIQPG